MKIIQWKILLRYRSILFMQGVIIGIVFLNWMALSKTNIGIETAIPFMMLYFILANDFFISLFDPESNEELKYQTFPIDYKKLIANKNIVTLGESIIYLIILSSIIVFILDLSYSSLFNAITFSLTILFLFVCFGNLISSKLPRFTTSNFSILRMFASAILILFLSIPYVVIKIIFFNVFYCYAYILFTVIVWRYISIPFSAEQFSKNSLKMFESV